MSGAADGRVRESALYVGRVRHKRMRPWRHAFEYPVFLAYLDLYELPWALDGIPLWSARRPAPIRFRRSDYLGETGDLRGAVLDGVEGELGRRPGGAVRMLTHLRTFGFVFNPVTFYFCHDRTGALSAVVAEITNTPWGERHAYVVDARGSAPGSAVRARFDKRFHVSPFMEMDCEYDWSLGCPDRSLRVTMRNRRRGRTIFVADMRLERRALTPRNALELTVRQPLLPLRILFRIYWQAFRLWRKGATFHPHPPSAGHDDRAGRPGERRETPC